MALITREYGPNAKGSKLTIQEMDDNLLFLESLGLTGTNYIYVAANGTDTENATELQAAYTTAKGMSPSLTNRITIVAAPGYYNFESTAFVMDTQYIDLVSLDGNQSIVFNSSNSAGTISITANDVFVKGVDVLTKSFNIATNLNLLKVENCKGGDYSFGSDPSYIITTTVSGTFINCIGGVGSFGLAGTVSGIFTNCVAGNSSFGASGTVSGTFNNCTGGDDSFGRDGLCSGVFNNCTGGEKSFGTSGTSSGTFNNCTSGSYSFGGRSGGNFSGVATNCSGRGASFGGGGAEGSGVLTGKLYYCRLTNGTFQTVSGAGITRYCLDGSNTANNQG
jgi:hypothetical protein